MLSISRNRAFTLLEVLVAAGLGALALTLVVQLLVPIMRISGRQTNRAELQQTATVVLDKLLDDVGDSTPASLVVVAPTPDETLLSAHRVVGVESDGSQRWADELVLYSWNKPSGVILRKTVPVPSGQVAPWRPNPADLRGFAADGSLPERRLALGVTAFSLDTGPGPGTVLPFKLHLRLERETAGQEDPQTLDLERLLYLNNG